MSVLSPFSTSRFSIRLGSPPSIFEPGLPVIAGEPRETLFPGAIFSGRVGSFDLFNAGDWLVGRAAAPIRSAVELEPTALQLYGELITGVRGRHLCRIWNFVPAINDLGPNGLENYRIFSRSRSIAFERAFGPEFDSVLPAASAVGTNEPRLTVVFVAHRQAPVHRENPRQVPAYEYPLEYGPRPPSFVRATIVPHPDGRQDAFVSGTSAIIGHATIAPGDTPTQTHCTLDNLRAISHACGLGPDLAAGGATARHVKVYVRHAAEQPAVAAIVNERLARSGDFVSYLAADICRAALNVEIEVSIFGAAQ